MIVIGTVNGATQNYSYGVNDTRDRRERRKHYFRIFRPPTIYTP